MSNPAPILRAAGFCFTWRRIAQRQARVSIWRVDAATGRRHWVTCAITDDSRDAWFVGFNPRVSCGIWIGLDNSSPIINGGSGSSLAAPVWSAIMRRAETSGYRGGSFQSPTIRTVALCPLSGRPAGPHCPGPLVRESLPADSIPAGSCPIHPNR